MGTQVIDSVEKQTIQREREKASFAVRDMNGVIANNDERMRRLEQLRDTFASDPVFSKTDRIFLSRDQMYKRSLEKMAHFHQKVRV